MPEQSVSASTAARYARTVERLRAGGREPVDARCKTTYEAERAAWVYVTRSEIKTSLTDLDRARRQGDLGRAADAFNTVRDGLAILDRYPPGTGNRETDRQRSSAFHGPARAEADRSNSKRRSLDDLPDDWRDRVQLEVRPQDRAAMAALSLTGCRPAECDGIRARRNGDQIVLTIRGAKVDEERGIKSRSIIVERHDLESTQAGRDLQEWMGQRQARAISVQGTTGAFRERVARAADRAGLPSVSCYTYRHAEARRLKAANIDRPEIAQRLGHRSDRSQSVYG
ncbi:MAG TPA: hypothetical protein VJ576_06745 [Rhodocyclaceae bacterium]|nr:hypothetical protein [Rhodocyclaceae bacterium]